ncbi:ankyrin repeat-containing domain protein [Coprinopsis sp. MPI-PUGE-AT-0042]|nr:ankyrin repeat-containing domain protein [Coprinopsis sp. MPI-PUGE-AT-0042]
MLGLLEGYYPSRFPSSPEPEEEQEAILTEWGECSLPSAELCRPLKTEEEFTALVLQTINADPAAPREYLSYFLIYATSPNIGYLDAITTLLKHGARIDQSAIRWAIHTRPNERAIQILEMYLEAGWNINQQIMSSGDALWEAVANQNDDLVKWLLEHGANPASGELAYGVPGLAFAAMKASPEVVTMLVEMGKLPIKNSRALEMAAKVGRVDNVVQLLELGAEVNSVTVRSKEVWWIETSEMDEGIGSALHFAASAGHVEVVKVLLEWGADLDLQDSKGFTPLQRARQAWKFGVVKVLWDSRR